ncbi:hypothetical protein B0H13DRAFT_2518840 [Mycena leptocephala]|nr:hypothetical protein B0H13DRAFT_2518840 [Mycena leptocephala]
MSAETNHGPTLRECTATLPLHSSAARARRPARWLAHDELLDRLPRSDPTTRPPSSPSTFVVESGANYIHRLMTQCNTPALEPPTRQRYIRVISSNSIPSHCPSRAHEECLGRPHLRGDGGRTPADAVVTPTTTPHSCPIPPCPITDAQMQDNKRLASPTRTPSIQAQGPASTMPTAGRVGTARGGVHGARYTSKTKSHRRHPQSLCGCRGSFSIAGDSDACWRTFALTTGETHSASHSQYSWSVQSLFTLVLRYTARRHLVLAPCPRHLDIKAIDAGDDPPPSPRCVLTPPPTRRRDTLDVLLLSVVPDRSSALPPCPAALHPRGSCCGAGDGSVRRISNPPRPHVAHRAEDVDVSNHAIQPAASLPLALPLAHALMGDLGAERMETLRLASSSPPRSLLYPRSIWAVHVCTRYPAQSTPLLLLSSQRTLPLVIAEDDVVLLSDCLSCPRSAFPGKGGSQWMRTSIHAGIRPSVRALLPRP